MRYEEFRDSIRDELRRCPEGITWKELKARLNLPYERPCPNWVERLEDEISLSRHAVSGRAKIWKVVE